MALSLAERLVVRPLRRDGVVVVDDRRECARPAESRSPHETLRIALAVPSFVMAEDERRHRIRERHRGDDLGADLRMDADFLELFLRQRTGLGQNVLGHGELADVVQERRGLHALDLAVATTRSPCARPVA